MGSETQGLAGSLTTESLNADAFDHGQDEGYSSV